MAVLAAEQAEALDRRQGTPVALPDDDYSCELRAYSCELRARRKRARVEVREIRGPRSATAGLVVDCTEGPATYP